MMRAEAVVVGLLVGLVAASPGGGAEETQVIEYVSVVGGWEGGCVSDTTVDLLVGFAKALGHQAGTGGFPGDAHCVPVPDSAGAVSLAADDASGHPIRVIVAQHDAAGYLAGTTLCGWGTVELLPETIDVAFTLAPYSTTTTPCPEAVPPTTGTLFVRWA